MSDKSGFVYLHRKVLDHWIFDHKHCYSKFEAWVDILLNVNQKTSSPIYISGERFVAERGQSLFSLETWANRWNWDKSKVRRFMDKLVSDEMIVINNEKKTTRLTVCNYDTYQTKRHSSDTAATPNNKIGSKEPINKRKEDFKNELAPYLNNPYSKDVLNGFFKYWTEKTHGGLRMRFEIEKTWELNLRLSNWSSGRFKKTEFKQHKNYNSDNSNVGN